MALTKSKTIYGAGYAPLMVSRKYFRSDGQAHNVTGALWWRLVITTTHPAACLPQPGVFTTPYPYWHQMGLPHTTSNDELVENALYRVRGFSPLQSLFSLRSAQSREVVTYS